MSFHKAPDAPFYTVDTAFEAAEDKEFARVKVEKDGQSCTVTVELDGKAPGLPTSATLNPPSAWPLHARRPSGNEDITPASNVKGEDIDFEFLREVKHPDVENGARKGDWFSASMERNLAAEMEEIKAAAVADGTFMKAPNGKPSNLNERQWLQVRTKAFADWFGDWKRAAELTFDVGNITYKDADAALKLLAKQKLSNNGKYGIPVEVNRDQREKLLSHEARRKSAANGFTHEEHYCLATNIQRLYRHAICLGDYRDVNEAKDVLAIRRFAAPFVVNGKRGYALLTVKITEHEHKLQDKTRVKLNEARAYSIELDELKGIDAQLTRLSESKMDTMVNFRAQYNPEGTVGNLVEQDSPSPGFDEIISDFNAKVNEYFDNVSKVVDENGEPLVVYHGTVHG